MAETLNDVLVKVSAIVSQTTTVVDTDDEYGVWRSFVNSAQKEWAETYDWPSLYTEYNGNTTAAGQATITLPADFRKLSGYPKAIDSNSVFAEYPEIDPQKTDLYAASDKYSYLLRTSSANYLILHPASISSGASLFVSYWRSPASLVSPANTIECVNSEYLVQKTISYIWESREDARFVQAKADAEKILSNLIENENVHGYAYNAVVGKPEDRYSFRLGRD